MKTCAASVSRQRSRPPSITMSALLRDTTAANLPSLPTAADKGSASATRQMSPPVRASKAATAPSADATVTTFPATWGSRGKPATLPTRAVHACLTPRTATLAPRSAGTGFALSALHKEQPANVVATNAANSARTKNRCPNLVLIVEVMVAWTLQGLRLPQRPRSHLAA